MSRFVVMCHGIAGCEYVKCEDAIAVFSLHEANKVKRKLRDRYSMIQIVPYMESWNRRILSADAESRWYV